ncbi:MAG TPA: 16S rRNA (cytidine(1402)-2'-O)-methyltransferase [Acidimicrobiales bacterium]|nr:16S rRNA (cytidine(1402)-2'-O)-methyltransferase [Acidimicrobiales bacterium]
MTAGPASAGAGRLASAGAGRPASVSAGAGGPAGPGRLVLVATPIGNLADLSPRAVAVLAGADVICCEDTRRTRALLTASGVAAAGRLVSVHAHNEADRVPQVLRWVADGRTVAVVTDAGTPGVSDPGARLVSAAAAAGLAVTTVPGPSSVVAALVVSGLPTDRFCVDGFLPRKGADRARRLADLAVEPRTTVLLEAPGRLAGTLADLAAALGDDRPVAVVRELTKVHEEVWRGTLAEAATVFGTRDAGEGVRGEVVVVVGGAPPEGPPDPDRVAAAVADRLAAGDTARSAARSVAEALGVPRREAYQLAIDLRTDRPDRSGQPGQPGQPDRSGRSGAPPAVPPGDRQG